MRESKRRQRVRGDQKCLAQRESGIRRWEGGREEASELPLRRGRWWEVVCEVECMVACRWCVVQGAGAAGEGERRRIAGERRKEALGLELTHKGY